MDWFSGSQHQPFEFEAGQTGVMLIHGFMGTPDELRSLGQALQESGISSHAHLLPGFGPDIARLGSVTANDWVQSARATWDKVTSQYQRRILLGYSMGAAVALHLATMRQVDRLILIAPLWRLLAGDPRVKFLPLVKHVMRQVQPFKDVDFSDPDTRAYFASAMPGVDLDDPETRSQLQSNAVLPMRTLDELRKLALASDRLAAAVSAPTLVIQGMQDTTVRPADTRQLATHFTCPLTLHQISGDHLIIRDDRPGWPECRELVVAFAVKEAG